MNNIGNDISMKAESYWRWQMISISCSIPKMSNVKCSFMIKFLLSSNMTTGGSYRGKLFFSHFKSLFVVLSLSERDLVEKHWKTLTTRVNIAVIECLLQVQVTLALILLTAGVGMPIGWVDPRLTFMFRAQLNLGVEPMWHRMLENFP